MKIKKMDIADNREDLLSHLILECMTKEHFALIDNKTDSIDFTCQVNGVDLDPRKWFDHINSQFYDLIKKQAYTLMQEKCSDLVEKVQLISNTIDRVAQENLDVKDEDRWR